MKADKLNRRPPPKTKISSIAQISTNSAWKSKIQQHIPPHLGVRPSQRYNFFALVKEDIKSKMRWALQTKLRTGSWLSLALCTLMVDWIVRRELWLTLGIIKLREPKPVSHPSLGISICREGNDALDVGI